MAWIERADLRTRRGRVWYDSDARQFSVECMVAALHYESAVDSGVFNQAINATPVRVNNAQLDGWTVTQNGWSYALGNPKTGALSGLDGVIGFGGRQGQNWLKFRLTRVGYLHWPTRAWQDIGGAPTYTRTNLSSVVENIILPTSGIVLPVQSKARWNSIWTTPGSGQLDISWRCHGDGLKEEVAINAAARTWITANRPPTTPASETWFGFVFRLDWSDIPRVYRAGVLQSIENDFDDGDGIVELHDALDRVLAFMPLGDVYVSGLPRIKPDGWRQPIRKRFWKDADGTYYLLVGVRCDLLNSMPAGGLVFDPTLTYTVGASTDDADTSNHDTAASTDLTRTEIRLGNQGSSPLGASGFRVTAVAVAQGTIITSATLKLTAYGTYHSGGTISVIGTCDDTDDALTFSGSPAKTFDNATRPRTAAASAAWDVHNWSDGTVYSLDVSGPVQEVISRASFASGHAIAVILDDNASTNGEWAEAYSWDRDPTKAGQLVIVVPASTSIKKVSGVLQASIKKAEGVVLASIKKMAGVSNVS